MTLPATGVAQLPRPTLGAAPAAGSATAYLPSVPVGGSPLPPTSVAASATAAPASPPAAGGLTVPGAAAPSVTVTAAVPLCPSLVAVIVAGPATTPLTSP